MTKVLLARFLLLIAMIIFALVFCSRSRAESYSWPDKIVEAKFKLSKMKIVHSVNTVVYKETRKIVEQSSKAQSKKKKPKSKTITVKRTDYVWKEAGLALMNLNNGVMFVTKIRKEGRKLIDYEPFTSLEIEPRVNGLTWNGRNTAFRVTRPLGWVVIADRWIERVNGKATESIYIPYSSSLHNTELIQIGNSHLENDVAVAFNTLYARDVRSLVSPDKRVSEVVPSYYPKNIVLTEHTDPQEFYAFKSGALKYSPFERVKILLALNGREAFPSFNYAGAVGLTQFTNSQSLKNRKPGTWNIIRTAYPQAKLSEFKVGATNHLESIEAAILLYDYNFNELVRVFGRGVVDDKNLSSYLYAAHNCGIGRVIQALKRTGPSQDWRVVLRKLGKTDETIIFLEKIDYLLAEK